ncbi:MAG: hypothetical protein Q4B75_04295 [Eubacteriales bacterium]|nr:hypothetical protein [Eubacteriales bacterium]
MTINALIQILNFFLIYSFLGWVVEVAYHGVCQGVVVNRGFLNGPVCPIYGFGMLLILYVLLPISDNLLVLFLGGMLLTTAIELFGGWILEKLFHMRWWDYSKEPLNLHGYICLKFSLAWGMGVVAIVRIIHPIVHNISRFVLRTPLKFILIPFMILFLVDIIATVATILNLKKELLTLEHLAKEMREFSDSMTEVIGGKAHEIDVKFDEGRVQAALGKAELMQQLEERREKIEQEFDERRRQIEQIQTRIHANKLCGYGRILAAFPHAVVTRRNVSLKEFIENHRVSEITWRIKQ